MRPQDIKKTALFTIEDELDDISGDGQTRAAQDLVQRHPGSTQAAFHGRKCGHYGGIFSGRRWRTIIYPQLRDFILAHNKAPKAAKEKVEAWQTPSTQHGGLDKTGPPRRRLCAHQM